MLASLVLSAVIGSPSCWQIFDEALRRRAAAPHPTYVTYNERIAVTVNSRPLMESRAHIDYRDDGLARVSDARFDYDAFLTDQPEPGPPELGPYGPSRQAWLPIDDSLPLIADVHSAGDAGCEVAETPLYKGHRTYHLLIDDPHVDRPTIKALWIDTTTHDIWKVIVSGYLRFVSADEPVHLTDFAVELGYDGPYLMVDHVTWAYRLHTYSQYDDLFGEYYLTDFAFPAAMPAAEFATQH